MERKAGSVVLCLIVLLPYLVQGQRVSRFGIKGGMNLASLNSSIDVETSPKVGDHVGVYYRQMFGDIITLRPEILYSVEGQVYKSTSQGHPNQHIGIKSTTTVHKLSTPVLIEAGRKVTIDLGAQVGWLLSASNTIHGDRSTNTTKQDLDDHLEVADFSVVGGIGFHPGEHFEASVRYNHGLTGVFEPFPYHPASVQFRSRVIQFTVGYSF